jgi:hypothetical protein
MVEEEEEEVEVREFSERRKRRRRRKAEEAIGRTSEKALLWCLTVSTLLYSATEGLRIKSHTLKGERERERG